MRVLGTRLRFAVGLALLVGVAACNEGATTVASSGGRGALTPPPAVRFSELHYDNAGADVQEAIELSGPAGSDVTGWTVVLYNGQAAGSAVYDTKSLSGAFPATCGDRGVIVINYPANGIQNGGTTVAGTADPDGMALVDASGAVVEFLSYEGSIPATTGPAAGMASIDLGVRELGTTAEGTGKSLQRDAAGAWSGPIASTVGDCNDHGAPPQPPEVVSVVIAPATASLTVGATQMFAASARDAANQPIAGVGFGWTSSAPAVVAIGATGVATALSAGSAVLTATAPNGSAGSATVDVTAVPPPPPPAFPDTRISELHYDNTGSDLNEAIEIEGPTGTELTGWTVVLYDGNGGITYNTTPLGGVIPATCDDGRGVIAITYPQNGVQNGGPDGLALVDATGQVVEFLSYEGTFAATNGPAAGLASVDIGAAEATSSPLGASLQRDVGNHWVLGTATLGGCNGSGAPPPPPANTVSFSGRLPSDPPLPIGFQDQLFATVRDASNAVITTTITWSTETPALATIDQNGVMTALAEGTATFRATAADGVTTATYALPMRVALASSTAVYAGNAEFGEPADADPSDDFIVRHPAYTASYNPNRGTPNWVSYDLDATHFGTEDRCDCFTFDPALPASFPHYTTADYTGAAAIAGYGIDRGHMTRSFDRTSASLDNAYTYYFSNVVPQAADLNQGPWAMMENDLGDLARVENKEVYIITGVSGSKGTLKNEGKVVIPVSTWKVAVILPRDHGLVNLVDYRDLEVIAVNMPNDPGVRNIPWRTYLVTVDFLEALTGYDLLALLPDSVEAAVEAGLKPPLAYIDGPHATAEGGSVTISAVGSLDPNGVVVGYAWDFGDGTTAASTSPTIAHVYAQDGIFPVRVTITDNDGLTNTAATTVSVTNVAPVIGAIAAATLVAGETYIATGTFVDPGVADAWAATVDYGEGGGAASLLLAGPSFALAHPYAAAGTFTVTVRISDGLATSTSTATVTVVAPPPPPPMDTPAQLLTSAITLTDQLVAQRKLGRAPGALLVGELALARAALERGRPAAARTTVRAVAIELDLLIRLGVLSAADASPLRTQVGRIIQVIGP